jgi:acetoin utilization deacetylase AcuC-like enzyme
MTCSIHKFGDFFPGTGTQTDMGKGKGKGYSVNIPLSDGVTDESFRSVFDPVSPSTVWRISRSLCVYPGHGQNS